MSSYTLCHGLNVEVPQNALPGILLQEQNLLVSCPQGGAHSLSTRLKCCERVNAVCIINC